MTLTQRAQATAAALCFGFVSIFALGLATGTPAQAEWLVEIEAAHAVHLIKVLKATEVIEAPRVLRSCAAARTVAVAETEI
ncbi:MAG: hypothetical protein IH996_10285 [Proteobacteria bacterium]|nr:hypothetical protein [Pseudomonadota bacterium]